MRSAHPLSAFREIASDAASERCCIAIWTLSTLACGRIGTRRPSTNGRVRCFKRVRRRATVAVFLATGCWGSAWVWHFGPSCHVVSFIIAAQIAHLARSNLGTARSYLQAPSPGQRDDFLICVCLLRFASCKCPASCVCYFSEPFERVARWRSWHESCVISHSYTMASDPDFPEQLSILRQHLLAETRDPTNELCGVGLRWVELNQVHRSAPRCQWPGGIFRHFRPRPHGSWRCQWAPDAPGDAGAAAAGRTARSCEPRARLFERLPHSP